MKVSDIGLIEGEGEFSEDKLAPAGDLGGDDTGSIAPVVLADRDVGRGRVVARSGRRLC